MRDHEGVWKTILADTLRRYMELNGISGDAPAPSSIVLETPPRPELGEYGFPLFPYAKAFRTAPARIAQALVPFVAEHPDSEAEGSAVAEGPYLNIRLSRRAVVGETMAAARSESWGRTGTLAGTRVMVEFSCPNTNKPLHLGHLRNNILGESVSRILAAAGAEVRKVNLINDRGVHICKSMLSYMKYGGGATPSTEGVKPDHFVGTYYVMFNRLKTEDPEAEQNAQELLRRWEAGDPEVIELWRRMNDWAVEGIRQTYRRQGIDFDAYYFESETYSRGKDEIMRGLARGVFSREDDGSVQIDLGDIGMDRKVLLRRDGTSLYITQDIGTAILRSEDWPFDRLVYVVASEQHYHFRVLFEVLRRLGHAWASDLHHLSYGLVNLPSGRMKTREGTVVDADDLLDELTRLAAGEIESKGRESAVGDPVKVAESVALGALHYYLLQPAPSKDMLYDPEQSLSFTGNTGPYLQYMGARASSILRKGLPRREDAGATGFDPGALVSDADWTLVRLVSGFPAAIDAAANSLEPSLVANYMHSLAAGFSSWYRENPVLANPDPVLAAARFALVEAAARTFRAGCGLLGIPFLESM